MPRGSAIMLALAVILLADQFSYASYIDPGDEDIEINGPDYNEDPSDLQILQDVGKRSSLIYVFRHACIQQGGNCDHRPGDCCHLVAATYGGPTVAASAWDSFRNGAEPTPPYPAESPSAVPMTIAFILDPLC